MTRTALRARLLGSVVLGVGISAFAPTAASAQCAVNFGVTTCADTTTTDTTAPQAIGSFSDRAYVYIGGNLDFTINVPSGITVDGYGLAFSYTGGTNSDATISNDGSIVVDAGNTPTAGGSSAAVLVESDNFIASYIGSGTINHLGTGDGLEVRVTGTGSNVINTTGAISAANGLGIRTGDVAASGSTSITTGAVTGTAGGILAVMNTTTGDVTIVTNGLIDGGTGINGAIWAQLSDGTATGDVSVTNNAGLDGYYAVTARNNGSGDISILGDGAFISNGAGGRTLYAEANGGGNVTIIGNGAVSGATNGGIYALSTGGDVVVTRGGAVSGVTGIEAATSGAGTVTVTTTNAGATVTSTAGDGVQTRSVDGLTTVNLAGNVSASGGQAVDAEATGTGGILISTTAGMSSTNEAILARTTTGDITVTTGAGNITSTAVLPVIDARASGDGDVTVITGAGAVSGGFTGITAGTNGGDASVTVGTGGVSGTDFGIQVVNLGVTGTQSVIVNGAVDGSQSGIRTLTSGARTITIGAAGSVTGGDQAIELVGVGATTINNSGDIGALSTDVAVLDAGGAVTINNLASGSIAGTLSLGGGNDALVNNGLWTTQGATDFGAGTDALTNNGTGVINIAGATSFTGLETTTNNGALNLNTFALTGSGTFTSGTTGLVDTNGSASLVGFTSITNNGTFDLAAGTLTLSPVAFTNNGRLAADEGLTTITGQTSFTSGAAGVIDLSDGVTGDQLTIASNYIGGGTLQVDVSQSAADRLILGGTVAGTTAVDINVLGVTTLGLNQLVVDASSASAGAFVTGNVTGTLNPLAEYVIAQVGQDYFVNAIPNVATAFDPLAVNNLVGDFWYQSGYEVMAQTRLPIVTEGFGVWGQIYGSIDKSGENDAQAINGQAFDADNKIRTSRYGIQAGVDFGLGGGRIGLTGGWGKAEASGNAEYEIEGWNIGLYGQFGGELGFHGEALVKYDDFDVEFTDGAFEGVDTDGHSWGGDLALGYRFQAGLVPILDLNVGLSHVRSKIDDVAAFGFGYDYGTYTSTRARGGIRAYFGGGWRPYIDATVHHEFDGKGDVALFDGATTYDLRSTGKGTWVRLEGGLGGKPNSGPMLAVWGDLGDRKGAGIRLGFRFGGAREEAVLPPPPPPPPPPPQPPATQTCPDGSVILATEVCPPPPPPPPPPPEPERG